MLTYLDRQRFEQIRALWETARSDEENTVDMVSWRDKSAPQQPVSAELHDNGARKFRRKLSYGLSLISNPLSQRKIIPGRNQGEINSLAVTKPSTTDAITVASACDRPALLARESTSLTNFHDLKKGLVGQADADTSPQGDDTDITPKPLPRSRTLGFIPISVGTEPDTLATGIKESIKLCSSAVIPISELDSVPSKIPSPSPPLFKHRCASPRRYLHHHTSFNASQQTKYIAAAQALVIPNKRSPARISQPLRSRTTPNLMKGSNARQTAGFMAPRQPGPKKPNVSQRSEKPVLQENVPIEKRINSRRPQTQESMLKRESLVVAGALYDRRSFGPNTPIMQGRRTSFVTLPTTSKQTSPRLTQNTPVTAKRIRCEGQTARPPPSCLTMKPDLASMPSFPDTSTKKISHRVRSSKPNMLRSYTQADLSRKTLDTPNGLGGVWQPSRTLAVVNHEVSKLSRCNTFHHLGTQPEVAPTVPLLPLHHKKLSLSEITQHLRMSQDTPATPRHGRIVSDNFPCQSIPEENGEEVSSQGYTSMPLEVATASAPSETPSSSTFSLTIFPSLPDTPQPSVMGTLPELGITTRSSKETSRETLGDVRGEETPEDADNSVFQVKDYMPPLYWAGRFQSRYDQWRTEAMIAELNTQPGQRGEDPLSEYRLDQGNLAACHIFAQLRALCTTDQAVDSLWVCDEFEYKYRKDHRMLGNQADLPRRAPPKQSDSETVLETGAGTLERALRKLTPRKSSLVNLMKGKGWNKSDEMKENDTLEEDWETSSRKP
ncbi:hypothetical protein COCCADRAFT_112908 [Bipolaris zeicola 26-R-13]|uniref:Uncharacterized protein n=1 Tax=Cochliobolus carbonum (strain 26-R-13) TaxID=930089 RepID=W6XNX8_COCC2|nr:uncharacterized protein COCCADRAFT_112908 [Bipolaris zeicola 26-R-13]EUC26960.1 hypothetical protein COCCADRAFT_112908 [Bipolaris zeicola 26-R-13]